MKKKYRRLTLSERVSIQECLDRGDSIRECAKAIGRAPSTVAREVGANRIRAKAPAHLAKCPLAKECAARGICGGACASPSMACRLCTEIDCRTVCPAYAERTGCAILERAPHVCNRCRHRRYFCGRDGRYVYDARAADAAAHARRSDCRRGIDLDEDRAASVLALLKEGLGRGLSPYEISVLYENEIGVHRSTIYRWVERGYGGLSNMELERKVGFRPRRKDPARRATSHAAKRAYAAFEALDGGVRAAAVEMDTVLGRADDLRALLTLYHRPSDMQLALLLAEKTCAETKQALLTLKKACPPALFARLFRAVLTDNGVEFADEDGIGAILGEGPSRASAPHLFYCDPRQSQQKGGCEKNHAEPRQILEKGLFSFDELEEADLAVVMSHANSNPREALCGMSPIRMFLAAYGSQGADLLDALGVRQVSRDEIVLTPDILDIERAARGKEPLTRLK